MQSLGVTCDGSATYIGRLGTLLLYIIIYTYFMLQRLVPWSPPQLFFGMPCTQQSLRLVTFYLAVNYQISNISILCVDDLELWVKFSLHALLISSGAGIFLSYD